MNHVLAQTFDLHLRIYIIYPHPLPLLHFLGAEVEVIVSVMVSVVVRVNLFSFLFIYFFIYRN